LQVHVETCVPEKEQADILERYEKIMKNSDLRRQMQEILSTYLLLERYVLEVITKVLLM